MKLLFGVQCTGNGHISRSRELVRELKELGHDVRCVLSGRDPAELREMEIFEPYVSYRGLSFTFARGKVRPIRTGVTVPSQMLRMYRDIGSFDARGFDLVICDFEPITARIARKRGIPSVGFGHQYAFVFDVPMVRSDPVSRYILLNMAPAQYPIGLHWHHFGHPILPPVIPDYLQRRETIPNKVLVYLPFESNEDIVASLSGVRDHEFFIYGTSEPGGDKGNLHHRPYSRMGFLNDLADCDGVICNAGFELPGEALHLGKRLLVKPLHGQLEQRSNALALVQLGLGQSIELLNTIEITRWLTTAPHLRPRNYPRTAEYLARWIDTGDWGHESALRLARSLWQEVPVENASRELVTG